MLRKKLHVLTILILTFTLAQHIQAQKQDLSPEDYARWQSIGTAELSPDGNWFAYNISLVEGDGWLMLKEAGTDTTGEHKFMHGFSPEFSADNRWLAFRIGLPEEKEREMRDKGESLQYNFALVDLSSMDIDTLKNISGYEFSDDGRFIELHKYQPEESKTRGRDVLLRNLESGKNQLIGNVAESAFSDDGSHYAYLIDSHEKLGNGVHLVNLKTMATSVLESDEAEFSKLTWHDEENHLAFLKKIEDEGYKDETHHIFAATNLGRDARIQNFDPAEMNGFPNDFRVVDYRSLQWSDDGDRLFFGIKEWEKAEETPADTTEQDKDKDEEEKEKEEDPDAHLDPTNVEVWHWQDDRIQPRQQVMEDSDLRSNFLSVWHLDEDRFVQLMDNHEHSATLTGDQMYAVLYDPTPYYPRFRESWNDVYVVDAADGSRTPVIERHEYVQSSPAGEYLMYFRNDDWWSYNIRDDRHTNLTEDADSRFNNYTFISGREQDQPFGSGQWAEEDRWVLLYDEFDVYKADPNGRSLEKMTSGSEDKIRYRQQITDYEEDALDPRQPIYLNMFGDRTKDRGYARADRRNRVETLIYEPKMISRLTKADDREIYAYQAQTATDSPDFYRTDNTFEDPEALTHTNPQQDEYYWADDELVTFGNERGEELEGRLLYPANYDPDKTYPMMVYIYERRSQTLHYYSIPTRTSPYNRRRFSSEGYFVFEPDITYELRQPGISAVQSVVPAVEQVIETGMINEDQIGLTGHSWGAYQTAFIITQTDLFSSAVAGAPLTNMISMYNSIYWNSGIPDATIFEISQGRFPDPYWQDWDNFIDNSPIFNIDQTDTPLMVMFGTDDGAVDFNQGVELYITMRRMGKPHVMLVYEGENHSLARRENQIDYATRAFEWHRHYTLGEEPRDWIESGLPHIERPKIEEEEK